MASRKTYFGIGWPKDPSESGPAGGGGGDAEDRSAPTVVDDEKVAEGLKQLRSWVQRDTPPEGSPEPRANHPTPPPGKLGARPTAVGHATGPPPAVQQRPIAPDPMRATMYGHDVHQFELPSGAAEPTPTPQQPPPPSTALVVADPGVRQRQQAGAIPAAVGRTPSDAFQLARQGEAQRLHRPAGMRRSSQQIPAPSALSRIPLASRMMFGFGVTALGVAIAFWFLSGNGSESRERHPAPPAPAPELAAPTPPPPVPERPPAPATVLPTAPERPLAPPAPRAAGPAPAPAPRIGAVPPSGDARPERPAPAVMKAPRRPREPKRELPTEVDETVTAAARVPIEKETPEQELAQPQDGKDSQDLKAAREPKETKEAREPKEPRDAKETKAAREARPPRDSRGRSSGSDPDAPLPPSLD